MRLELTGRHVTITPTARTLVERRLDHMARMLHGGVVSVQVVVTREKSRHHAEMTLHARGEHFLHSEATGRDLPTAVAAAAEKLEHQVQKLKSRWTEGKRQGNSKAKAASPAPGPEQARRRGRSTEGGNGDEGTVRVIRSRRTAVKPMSIEDAALELEAGKDAVVVFRNAVNDAVTVLFRRPDGHIGLIEPDR